MLKNLNPETVSALVGHVQYAEAWKVDALKHQKDGNYSWVMRQLQNYKPTSILDIGTGSGQGVLELLKRNRDAKALCVEENPLCLQEALSTLKEFKPSIQYRHQYESYPDAYSTIISSERCPLTEAVCLLQGDIFLTDPILKTTITSRSYDLITLWFRGQAPYRSLQSELRYRNPVVQNERLHADLLTYVLDVARTNLKLGGLLQIVDIIAHATDRKPLQPEDIQAAPIGDLEVMSCNVRKFEPSEDGTIGNSKNISCYIAASTYRK